MKIIDGLSNLKSRIKAPQVKTYLSDPLLEKLKEVALEKRKNQEKDIKSK